MELVVNGLPTQARVDQALIEGTLLPALTSVMRHPRARTTLVFLVGPPGVGKSTLAAIVADAGRRHAPEPLDVDVVGIDGFHYPQRHLTTHHLPGDPSVLLSDVKGAPETFDVAALADHLEAATERDVTWPTYDRRIHDVVPGTSPTGAELLLVEGNWLLLDEPGWRDLASHAAFVIYLDAEPELLRGRLIERKVAGGLGATAAADFYERSDRANVERVKASSDLSRVDLTLQVLADGTITQGETR